MNLSRFFEYWQITENPFRGEEARQDPVFLRLGTDGARAGAPAAEPRPEPIPDAAHPLLHTSHSDFEKIAGEFDRPSTSIVFGEKGSGKTAIRIQLARRIGAYNLKHPEARCLLVAYDDLNPVLDRFYDRMAGDKKASVAEVFRKFRLVDHVDALMGQVAPRIIDGVLDDPPGPEPIDLGPEPRKAARRMDPNLKRDLLMLQAVYDRPEQGGERSRRLRRRLRLVPAGEVILWNALAAVGWLVPAAVIALFYTIGGGEYHPAWAIVFGIAAALWLGVLFKRLAWDRLVLMRLGRRIRKQVRVLARSDDSYASSLAQLDPAWRVGSLLPMTDSDEQRYAMLDRLRRVLRAFGYASMVVVLDRVDEPTLISGDPERMQAVVLPLLNNKFLQQHGIGFKMLLPIELRHALFRESAAFFQEARLDKQNLIERLTWTGAMLYDLCNARLQACRAPSAEPITLLDLFDEDVTRQDLVDALDQMQQPRDAFKMLYRCLTEHCSNVTEDQGQWRIPRLILEGVRKEQAERVRQLYRGVRPA